MTLIKFQRIILLVAFYCLTCQACLVSNAKNCNEYSLLQKPILHAFIPVELFDDTCRRLLAALKCVYTDGRLNQCAPYQRRTFDIQLGVIEAVCLHKREEYIRSSQCFCKQDVVLGVTTKCLTALASTEMNRDPCGTFKLVSECAKMKVQMTDGCQASDAALMGYLVETYLQPMMEPLKCSGGLGVTTADKSVQANAGFVRNDKSRGYVPGENPQEPLPSEKTTGYKSSHAMDATKNDSQKTWQPNPGLSTNEDYFGEVTQSSNSSPSKSLVPQPWQGATILTSSNTHVSENRLLETFRMKSTQEKSLNHAIKTDQTVTPSGITTGQNTSSEKNAALRVKTTKMNAISSVINEHNETLIHRSSTIPFVLTPDEVNRVVTGSSRSSQTDLESQNVEYEQKVETVPVAQPHTEVKVKSLKSTQSSGSDLIAAHCRQSCHGWLLCLSVVLFLLL